MLTFWQISMLTLFTILNILKLNGSASLIWKSLFDSIVEMITDFYFCRNSVPNDKLGAQKENSKLNDKDTLASVLFLAPKSSLNYTKKKTLNHNKALYFIFF